MTDESIFTVKLRDKTAAGSRSAKKNVDGLSRSMSKAERSAARLDRALGKRYRDTKGRLRESDGKFAGDGSGKTGGMGGMLGSIVGGNLISSAVMGIGRLVGGVVAASAEMVMFRQNSLLAFDALKKHSDTGGQLLELSSVLARRFGMDLVDTTHGMQKLLAAQFNPELATDIIKMGADLRSIGAAAEDTKGAIRAITQIKGTGILQGDELNQLANAGVSIDLIRQEIGKLMGGKSNLEVLKAQEAGKIDADTAITGILNAVMRKTQESKLGEAGERFANTTIDGLLGRFKAFAQDRGSKMLDKLIAPLTKMVSDKFDRFVAFLESDEGDRAIDKIGDGLLRAVTAANDFVTAFGGSFIDTMRESGGLFASMFDDAPSKIGNSNVKLKDFGEAMGKLAGWTIIVAENIGKIVDALSVLPQFGSMIGDWAGKLSVDSQIANAQLGASSSTGMDSGIASDAEMWSWVTSWFGSDEPANQARQSGVMIAQGMREGILSGSAGVIDAQDRLSSGVLASTTEAFDINSPSRVMKGLGRHVASGFAAGIESGSGRVSSASMGMTGSTLGGVARHMRGSEFGSVRSMSLDGASIRGGISVSLHTEVHTGSGDAGEIAELSARATTREIERFFRGLTEET